VLPGGAAPPRRRPQPNRGCGIRWLPTPLPSACQADLKRGFRWCSRPRATEGAPT
jgi:hypothetical protein